MKAFRLNEYELWAARDAEEAITAAMQTTGLSREETVDEMYFGEIGPETPFNNSDDSSVRNMTTVGAILDQTTQPSLIGGWPD